MRLGRRLALLAAVTTLLGGPVAATVAGASPALAATSDGWVRCANLSPGTPEDVYLYPFGDPGHPIVLKHASTARYTTTWRSVRASTR